ncbi:MAG: hypothetical protein ACTSXQ_06905 [Alphaproteobacteria bacterium]
MAGEDNLTTDLKKCTTKAAVEAWILKNEPENIGDALTLAGCLSISSAPVYVKREANDVSGTAGRQRDIVLVPTK